MVRLDRRIALALTIGGGAWAIALLISRLGVWVLPAATVLAFAALAFYRLDWGIYLLIFVLPFMAIGGTHVTLVQEFKRLLVVGVGAAWVVHVVLGKRTVRIPPLVAGALVVLGTAAVLSIFRAPQPGVALTSTARLLAYGVVYVLVLVDVLREPHQVWRAVRVLLVSATLTAAFGLYQFAAHFIGWPTFLNPYYRTEYALPRIHSFMEEPLWLSNYLLVVFPIALALFCWKRQRWPALSLTAVTVTGLGIVIAASRLGWAVFLLVAALFPIVAGRRIDRPRAALVGGTFLLFLLGASAAWLQSFGSVAELTSYVVDFATFASPEHGEGDLRWHVRLFDVLPEALKTSPVIGVGTNNVGFRFHLYMPRPDATISTTNSTYLDLLIETGGLGLVSFLTLLAAGFVAARAGLRRFASSDEGALCLGLVLGFTGMVVHLAQWSGWREAHVWFLIGLALTATYSFGGQDAECSRSAPATTDVATSPFQEHAGTNPIPQEVRL